MINIVIVEPLGIFNLFNESKTELFRNALTPKIIGVHGYTEVLYAKIHIGVVDKGFG